MFDKVWVARLQPPETLSLGRFATGHLRERLVPAQRDRFGSALGYRLGQSIAVVGASAAEILSHLDARAGEYVFIQDVNKPLPLLPHEQALDDEILGPAEPQMLGSIYSEMVQITYTDEDHVIMDATKAIVTNIAKGVIGDLGGPLTSNGISGALAEEAPSVIDVVKKGVEGIAKIGETSLDLKKIQRAAQQGNGSTPAASATNNQRMALIVGAYPRSGLAKGHGVSHISMPQLAKEARARLNLKG